MKLIAVQGVVAVNSLRESESERDAMASEAVRDMLLSVQTWGQQPCLPRLYA